MFKEAKFEYLANLITFDIDKVDYSIIKLKKEYNNAIRRPKKVRILRAVNLASVRARASSKRKNIKPITKKNYIIISQKYGILTRELKIKLKEEKIESKKQKKQKKKESRTKKKSSKKK